MRFLFPALFLLLSLAACTDSQQGNNGSSEGNSTTVGMVDTITGTPGTFYKRYSGTAGSRHIILNLVKYKDLAAASYYTLSDNNPAILIMPIDSAAAANDFIFREGKNGEIVWHLKANGARLSGTIANEQAKSNDPVTLSEEYPAGSARLVAYAYDATGRLLERAEQPNANASYGMVWPAGSWNPELSAFARSRIAVTMNFEGKKGVDEGLRTRASRYFAAYRNELRTVVDSTWPEAKRADIAYHYNTTFYHYVIYNDNDWLVLEDAVSTYTGGAHGMYSSTFKNMDIKTSTDWNISRVVTDTASLKPYLELAARDYFGIGNDQDLSSRLLVSEIPATANFYITPSGLTFVYNPYDLASYSDGQIKLFLPYRQIMPVLTQDFKARMNFTSGSGIAVNAAPALRHSITASYFSTNLF